MVIFRPTSFLWSSGGGPKISLSSKVYTVWVSVPPFVSGKARLHSWVLTGSGGDNSQSYSEFMGGGLWCACTVPAVGIMAVSQTNVYNLVFLEWRKLVSIKVKYTGEQMAFHVSKGFEQDRTWKKCSVFMLMKNHVHSHNLHERSWGGGLRPQDSLLENGQETICAVSVNTLAKWAVLWRTPVEVMLPHYSISDARSHWIQWSNTSKTSRREEWNDGEA